MALDLDASTRLMRAIERELRERAADRDLTPEDYPALAAAACRRAGVAPVPPPGEVGRLLAAIFVFRERQGLVLDAALDQARAEHGCASLAELALKLGVPPGLPLLERLGLVGTILDPEGAAWFGDLLAREAAAQEPPGGLTC